MEHQEIKDKVIAITGASSGIGEAIARYLANKGGKVVLGARRTENLEVICKDIITNGGSASYTLLDVTDPESMQKFVAFTLETYGDLDVFVNNAGVMPLSYINEYKVDEWHRMVDVNIKGVLHGIAAALPVFEKKDSGHFLNITSVGDRWVGPTSTVYSATKFAVRAITEGLRQEVSPNIRVGLVAPGATESELAESISDPKLKKLAIEQFRANTIPASAIAKAVAYAISQPKDIDVNEIVIRPSAQRSY